MPTKFEFCFRVDDFVSIVPVVHGSAEFTVAIEQWLLTHRIDVLAVPLPKSFQTELLSAVKDLPVPSIVIQPPHENYSNKSDWTPDVDRRDEEEEDSDGLLASYSYVPVEPCQPVIAAMRHALLNRIPIEFVECEVDIYRSEYHFMPDGHALKSISLQTIAAAVLPSVQRPATEQSRERIRSIAVGLKRLRRTKKQILLVCSIDQWPWIREQYSAIANDQESSNEIVDDSGNGEATTTYRVREKQLAFLMDEIPFIAAVYEDIRQNENLNPSSTAVDAIKQLLMSARASYTSELGKRARKISPLLLSQTLKYIRNLTLLDNRLTPDLYTICLAAKQVVGDQYAIHVIEAAINYHYIDDFSADIRPSIKLGDGVAELPIDGWNAESKTEERVAIANRLPGNPRTFRSIELNRKSIVIDPELWKMRWNPFRQCSWPPEDQMIESLRTRVSDRARAIIGADLAKVEKFTTSMMDGIDIRETLRHWYDTQLYVKIQPPSIGNLDACVMLFDSEADPREYPWRTTWYAEHAEESTLAFFATDFRNEVLGPGIAVANYGGVLFLYPPRSIPDIWSDPNLDEAETLNDRLVAAAIRHSQSKHIALLSPKPPTAVWRKWAKRSRKSLVHVPLAQFSEDMIQRLKIVHVLNGKEVRSYAAHFIKKI